MQRLITATGEVLVWGEAAGALGMLADAYDAYARQWAAEGTYRAGGAAQGSTAWKEFVQTEPKERYKVWIANMGPNPDLVAASMKEMMRKIYEEPAKGIGYPRWGIKEVRCGMDEANWLLSMYPEAKFIWLVRNPVAVLESIKKRRWVGKGNLDDPLGWHAEHWRRLASQFRAADFGYYLRFEDFLNSREIRSDVAKYLGVDEFSEDVMKHKGVDWEVLSEAGLTWREKRRIRKMIGDEMEKHGYV